MILFHETEGCPGTVRSGNSRHASKLFSYDNYMCISTSLTVPGQPSPRFHVEAWLPFRNREMDHSP